MAINFKSKQKQVSNGNLCNKYMQILFILFLFLLFSLEIQTTVTRSSLRLRRRKPTNPSFLPSSPSSSSSVVIEEFSSQSNRSIPSHPLYRSTPQVSFFLLVFVLVFVSGFIYLITFVFVFLGIYMSWFGSFHYCFWVSYKFIFRNAAILQLNWQLYTINCTLRLYNLQSLKHFVLRDIFPGGIPLFNVTCHRIKLIFIIRAQSLISVSIMCIKPK